MFPNVPQSSQPESLGFPSYPLPLDTPTYKIYILMAGQPTPPLTYPPSNNLRAREVNESWGVWEGVQSLFSRVLLRGS